MRSLSPIGAHFEALWRFRNGRNFVPDRGQSRCAIILGVSWFLNRKTPTERRRPQTANMRTTARRVCLTFHSLGLGRKKAPTDGWRDVSIYPPPHQLIARWTTREQSWALCRALGCVNPGSGHPHTDVRESTEPRVQLMATLRTTNI